MGAVFILNRCVSEYASPIVAQEAIPHVEALADYLIGVSY